jgi:hypothetical protein
MGNTDGTPIGNILDAIKVNLRDAAGNAFGTNSNPISVAITSASNELSVNEYGQAAAVASGATTTVVTYTVPLGKTMVLERVTASGENIALFTIFINATQIDAGRTYFGGALNVEFDYTAPANLGYPLVAGDVVTLKVLHNRPTPANFEGRIQMSELN